MKRPYVRVDSFTKPHTYLSWLDVWHLKWEFHSIIHVGLTDIPTKGQERQEKYGQHDEEVDNKFKPNPIL